MEGKEEVIWKTDLAGRGRVGGGGGGGHSVALAHVCHMDSLGTQ